MGPADPDAIWKPGFTGEIVYPSRQLPADGPGGGHGRRRTIAIAAAAILAGVLATLLVVRANGPDSVREGALRLPSAPEERWRLEVPGRRLSWVTGDVGNLLLVVDEAARELIAIDARAGAEAWRAAIPLGEIHRVHAAGAGVVLATVSGHRYRTVAFDVEDGTPMWSTEGDAWTVEVIDDTLIQAQGFDQAPFGAVEVVDIRSGDVVGRLEDVQLPHDRHVVRRTGASVSVHELPSLDQVACVELEPLRLAGADDVSVAPVEAGVVVAWPSGALLVGRDGVQVGERLPHAAGRTGQAQVRVLDRVGRYVALQGPDWLSVVEVTDQGLEQRWWRQALLLDSAQHPDGSIVAAIAHHRGPNLEMPGVLVDVATGEVGGPAPDTVAVLDVFSRFAAFADDGYLDRAPTADGSQVEIIGRSLTGEERWRLDVPAGGLLQLVDGGLLAIDGSSSEHTVLTLYA